MIPPDPSAAAARTLDAAAKRSGTMIFLTRHEMMSVTFTDGSKSAEKKKKKKKNPPAPWQAVVAGGGRLQYVQVTCVNVTSHCLV